METLAYIERVDPLFTAPDCVRDEEGRPVIYESYLKAVESLAESIVESLQFRLQDAKIEEDIEQKINLYDDVCGGGPISDYYVCAVTVRQDGTVVDEDNNVYWPRARIS